jgi:hypothetical protein
MRNVFPPFADRELRGNGYGTVPGRSMQEIKLFQHIVYAERRGIVQLLVNAGVNGIGFNGLIIYGKGKVLRFDEGEQCVQAGSKANFENRQLISVLRQLFQAFINVDMT